MGRLRLKLFAAGAAILSGLFASPAFAACREVDDFSPVLMLAKRTAALTPAEEAAAFEREVVAPHTSIYNRDVLLIAPGPALDRRAQASLAYLRNAPHIRKTFADVRAGVRSTEGLYERTFPDFRCTFTLYYIDGLDMTDGGGRQIDGGPAIVFGIDQIDQERGLVSMPVFLRHEFFHRYHSQAAGFSDDLEDRQEVWRGLWAEGLASYVSGRLTPGSTMAKALLVGDDYEAKAKPLLPQMTADLIAHFDDIDASIYGSFFHGGSKRAAKLGYPPRCGYFIGYLVAQELAKTHSLYELAHLKGEPLRAEIIRALQTLGRE